MAILNCQTTNGIRIIKINWFSLIYEYEQLTDEIFDYYEIRVFFGVGKLLSSWNKNVIAFHNFLLMQALMKI